MQIILIALALLLHPQAPAQQEQQVMQITAAKVAQVVEAKESGWDFIPGVCTCPPLVKGQKSQSVGSWERATKEGEQEVILMDIYEIGSAEEASEWIRGFDRKDSGAPCRVEKFSLGDEAYQLFCPEDSSNPIRLSNYIFVRKGNYIVRVRGGAPEAVERFARYALEQLADT